MHFSTIWVKKISNTGPKIRFRKQYQCWTQGSKVVKKELLFDARRCKGTLDMKVLTDTPLTRRKNKHIRMGLNAVVKINFNHLHPVVDIEQPFAFFVHNCAPQPEPLLSSMMLPPLTTLTPATTAAAATGSLIDEVKEEDMHHQHPHQQQQHHHHHPLQVTHVTQISSVAPHLSELSADSLLMCQPTAIMFGDPTQNIQIQSHHLQVHPHLHHAPPPQNAAHHYLH